MERIWQHILGTRALQTPDFNWVKVELCLRLGAESRVVVLVLNSSITVPPKANGVKVLEIGCALGLFQRVRQLLTGSIHAVTLEH